MVGLKLLCIGSGDQLKAGALWAIAFLIVFIVWYGQGEPTFSRSSGRSLSTAKLSNLTVFTTDPDAEYPEMILSQEQLFQVRVTVEFGGPGTTGNWELGIENWELGIGRPFYVHPKSKTLHKHVRKFRKYR